MPTLYQIIRGFTREHVHRVLLRRLLTEMKTGDDETTRTFRPLNPDLAELVIFFSRIQPYLLRNYLDP